MIPRRMCGGISHPSIDRNMFKDSIEKKIAPTCAGILIRAGSRVLLRADKLFGR